MKPFATILVIGLLWSGFVVAQQAPAPPVPAWGTILGRVVYDGKAPVPRVLQPGLPPPAIPIIDESLAVGTNGGLANVFVYLRTKPTAIHPGYVNAPPQKQTLTTRNYRFEPHAQAVWTNDELELINVNPARGHNFNYFSMVQGFNILLAPGARATRKLQAAESIPMNVSCNIFPWMSGKLLVRDNPYFCVTDDRGIFCIPNLPTNQELEFVFWHERCGYLAGMPNQAPNPAHNIVLNQKGRLVLTLTEPVLDLGEFLADPKKFKEPTRSASWYTRVAANRMVCVSEVTWSTNSNLQSKLATLCNAPGSANSTMPGAAVCSACGGNRVSPFIS